MKKGFNIISPAENSRPQGFSLLAVFNVVMPRCFYSASQPCKKWLSSRITTFRDDFIKTKVCEKGFTLIELLVVVLIIGILAAVALPQYTKAVEKSRLSTALAMVGSLEKALNVYRLENPSATGYDIIENLSVSVAHLERKVVNSIEIHRCSKDFCFYAWCSSDMCSLMAERQGEGLYATNSILNSDGSWERKYLICSSWKKGDIFGLLRSLGYEESMC